MFFQFHKYYGVTQIIRKKPISFEDKTRKTGEGNTFARDTLPYELSGFNLKTKKIKWIVMIFQRFLKYST